MRDRSMQRLGIAQNAESKASKSFRLCDADGARFGVRRSEPTSIQRCRAVANEPERGKRCLMRHLVWIVIAAQPCGVPLQHPMRRRDLRPFVTGRYAKSSATLGDSALCRN
jgi:hypothetical protein